MRLNFHDLVNSIKVMSIVVSLYFNNSYTVISHNLQGTSYFKFIKHVIRPIFSVFYSFNIFFCLFLNPAPIKWSFGQVNCYKFWFILFFKFFIIIIFFYFTILYWFCHTSTCIRHGCQIFFIDIVTFIRVNFLKLP